MKKLIFTLVFLFVAGNSFAVQIDSEYQKSGPYYKLKRGIVNIATSPGEIAKNVKENLDDSKGMDVIHKAAYAFGGTIKGLAYFVGRLGSGLWDFLTPNIDVPKNEEPLMTPEYVWE